MGTVVVVPVPMHRDLHGGSEPTMKMTACGNGCSAVRFSASWSSPWGRAGARIAGRASRPGSH